MTTKKFSTDDMNRLFPPKITQDELKALLHGAGEVAEPMQETRREHEAGCDCGNWPNKCLY